MDYHSDLSPRQSRIQSGPPVANAGDTPDLRIPQGYFGYIFLAFFVETRTCHCGEHKTSQDSQKRSKATQVLFIVGISAPLGFKSLPANLDE